MNSSDSRPFHPRPIQPRMIIYTLYPIHECFMSPAREAAIDAMLLSHHTRARVDLKVLVWPVVNDTLCTPCVHETQLVPL